jgi:hypoxanthine phosphoribosyltransferase
MADALPKDFDAIVAIPRAGMLVGSVLALKLGSPLTYPQSFSKGFVWHSGFGANFNRRKTMTIISQCKKVLLVDDSINNGRTMKMAEEFVRRFNPNMEIYKAAITATWKGKKFVDYYHVLIPAGWYSVYEWQLSTGYKGNNVCSDMDGVLTEECSPCKSEDIYLAWIKTAKPLFKPKYELNAIITDRLEKHRKETEEWLAKNNIEYKQLLMAKTVQDRSDHKKDCLLELKPIFYIESNYELARMLWNKTRIPILCYQKMVMLS